MACGIAEHALKVFGLPWHHTDPFDRQIFAQALEENIPIVTSNEAFRRYHGYRQDTGKIGT